LSNRVDWLRWSAHTLGDTRDRQVDDNAQESGQNRDKGVLSTAVLWNADKLLKDPANEVVPAEGRSKGETRDNRVEGLGLQFLGHEVDSFNRSIHVECFIYYTGKIYSGKSSSSYIRLYLLLRMDFLD